MRKIHSYLLVILLSTMFFSCKESTFHEGKFFAGGVYATADQLNDGKTVYLDYCVSCHGFEGDGNGVSAKGLFPAPRNFKLGIYKFGNVVAGELPHDKTLHKIIRHGLNGTPMLQWDMSKEQVHNVIQYIKTFAPKVWEGKGKKLGEELVVSKDPYGASHKSFAIEKGKEVYHLVAQCQSCHRAYASKKELNQISLKVNNEEMTEFDEDMYKIKLQESEHGYKVLPPDFTFHSLRSVGTMKEKPGIKDPERIALNDLYLRLLAGAGGAAMPSWKDVLQDNEIWAVAYYVRYLQTFTKDQAKRKKFLDSIEKN